MKNSVVRCKSDPFKIQTEMEMGTNISKDYLPLQQPNLLVLLAGAGFLQNRHVLHEEGEVRDDQRGAERVCRGGELSGGSLESVPVAGEVSRGTHHGLQVSEQLTVHIGPLD